MKWAKAISKIKEAQNAGRDVIVKFHRKWARNDHEFREGRVEMVVDYLWNGETAWGVEVTTPGGEYYLEEGNWIIDEFVIA